MSGIRATPRQRRLVLCLISSGFGERVAARALACSRAELRRHFADQLAAARADRQTGPRGAYVSGLKTLRELLSGIDEQTGQQQ